MLHLTSDVSFSEEDSDPDSLIKKEIRIWHINFGHSLQSQWQLLGPRDTVGSPGGLPEESRYVLEKDDSNVTPDTSNICNNDNQVDQNAAKWLWEANSCRDWYLIAIQKQYRMSLRRLLALKDIDIKEGLKTKACEISVVNQKHDELVKKECRKPKRVKDYTYHKEKMMMCKQAEYGVPLQADWLADTDEEIDEQELEAHYSFMAKIQEVLPEESSSTEQPLEQVQNHDDNNVFANERRHSEQPESINDTYVLEKNDSNVTPDSSNICNNDNQVDQNAAEYVDEHAALANLITDLTLDTEEKNDFKAIKESKCGDNVEKNVC
ncbi:hypothetical protein Tco_0276164 [Tanacetum coccineum]